MYKLIVSDLDETLLRTDGSVSDADAATVRRLTAAGIKFVPNTGRGFASVKPVTDAIGTTGIAGEYVLTYNGGALVENSTGALSNTHALDFETANAIYKLAMAHPEFGSHIYTFHHVYIGRINDDEKRYVAQRAVDYEDWDDLNLDRLAGRDIVKVIFFSDRLEERQALAAEVAAHIDTPLTVTYSSGRYVEFNPAGVNKGRATLELGEKLGIAPSEIIALGDNLNDLPMIEDAGMGVAVANAAPEIKAAANLVLPVTHNESPVTALATELHLL